MDSDFTTCVYSRNMKTTKTKSKPQTNKLAANDVHVEAFKALAHRTRLKIFIFLVRSRAEVATGDIQKNMRVKGPTLSHHLHLLRRAALVQSRREERYIYYSVQKEMAGELAHLLTACS